MARSKIGFNLQLPPDVYEDFKQLCNLKGETMTRTATDLIRSYLEKNRAGLDALKKQNAAIRRKLEVGGEK